MPEENAEREDRFRTNSHAGHLWEAAHAVAGWTGDDAVANLPETIKVAGYDFAIRKMPALEAMGKRKWGEFCHIEHYIAIQAQMPTPHKAVDTFLHEALHAIWWAWGIHDDDKEERTVAALGTALMTLHRDNPWLSGWLARCLR